MLIFFRTQPDQSVFYRVSKSHLWIGTAADYFFPVKRNFQKDKEWGMKARYIASKNL